jgi:hypothetical protein
VDARPCRTLDRRDAVAADRQVHRVAGRRGRLPVRAYRLQSPSGYTPRERYECIDPGKDPNPADVAIQIHVLMLLAKADPPAARALCEALRQHVADEDVWVYYKMAPPLLILRQRELHRADCPMPLPPARLRSTASGQEIWIEAMELLQRVGTIEGKNAIYPEIIDLLRKLAADEFSLLARTPPLIYHNDLSASVRRFYWSEELGYALWLRLYFENERAGKR